MTTQRRRTKHAPTRARAPSVKALPINFRMPQELRLRLRTFARARHLSESEALRLIVAEHLDEIESERELSDAERWQFEQAYETWQRYERGEGRTVTWAEILQTFDEARVRARAVHELRQRTRSSKTPS